MNKSNDRFKGLKCPFRSRKMDFKGLKCPFRPRKMDFKGLKYPFHPWEMEFNSLNSISRFPEQLFEPLKRSFREITKN